MKVTEIGKAEYIVQTYYVDGMGELHCEHDHWMSKENAKKWYDLRSKYIGQFYEGEDWTGIISSVFIFKAKLCTIE